MTRKKPPPCLEDVLELDFRAAVAVCWKDAAFMRAYRRLTGHKLGLGARSPIEQLVDEAAGAPPPILDAAEAKAFLDFVRDYVWAPVLQKKIEDLLKEAT